MLPTICTFGPFQVYSYGLMLAIAILVCSFLLKRDAAAYKIPADTVYDLVFWSVLGGIAGARVFFIILNWDIFADNLREVVMLQRGGLSWQGGLILGTIAGVTFIRFKKLPFRPVLDLIAPYLALGQSIGRIGCFLNGCCYGKAVAWGIYFPVHHARLHPTQLYASAALFLVYAVLKIYQKHQHAPGQVLALYFMLAGGQRFVIEFFRADHELTAVGLSVFQLVSLGLCVTGALFMKYFNVAQSKKI